MATARSLPRRIQQNKIGKSLLKVTFQNAPFRKVTFRTFRKVTFCCKLTPWPAKRHLPPGSDDRTILESLKSKQKSRLLFSLQATAWLVLALLTGSLPLPLPARDARSSSELPSKWPNDRHICVRNTKVSTLYSIQCIEYSKSQKDRRCFSQCFTLCEI